MKIRNSFVSNSSSSSFVFLGVKVKDIDYDRIDEAELDYLPIEDRERYFLIGKSLGDWDDESGEGSNSISVESIANNVKEIKRKLKKLDLDDTHEPIELHFGMRVS